MTETTAARLKSAAIPDADFDRLSLDEKRAWLKSYLHQGSSQIASGQTIGLESEEEITAFFRSIRAEAHEEADLNP